MDALRTTPLGVRSNPGRPGNIPAPPPLRLPPGVKPDHTGSDSKKSEHGSDTPLKVLSMDPVRTVEPVDPVAEPSEESSGEGAASFLQLQAQAGSRAGSKAGSKAGSRTGSKAGTGSGRQH